MNSCAGAWLNCVVCIERTIAMSSTTVDKLGSRFESSAPHPPCLDASRHGKSQRVIDGAGRDLVVTREPHENRQPGGVRRGPRVRALLADGPIPDRSRVRAPLAAFQGGFVEVGQ